jgi:hypothetical protein
MIVGVPKEIKEDEYRVAMLPVGVEELVSRGHSVIVQEGAGLGSGLADEAYEQAGAMLVKTGKEIFEQADLIVKVKEPNALYLFPFCRRSRADPSHDRYRSNMLGLRDPARLPRSFAPAHTDERSRRSNEHPGRC